MGAQPDSSDIPISSPKVFEAELASGPSGAVLYGPELTREQAVGRREKGLDIVVRGLDTKSNRIFARGIEAEVGHPTPPQAPEKNAGPLALPHFHQDSREPEGHSFYETDKRKARKRK